MPAEPAATHLHPVTGHTRPGPVTVADAVAAFLSTPRVTGSANTRRAYIDVLYRLADQIGPGRELAHVEADGGSPKPSPPCGAAQPRPPGTAAAPPSAPGCTWCTAKARWSAPTLTGHV